MKSINDRKVSTNDIKPRVAEKYNLVEKPTQQIPYRTEPFKVSDYYKPSVPDIEFPI